jgi:colanic acid biosynthesis glycosyl transferase WcaI
MTVAMLSSPSLDSAGGGERFPRAVLVVSINYAPEPTGFAPHVTALVEFLKDSGWNVAVLTGFPFAPHWKRWPEYAGRWMTLTQTARGRLIRLTHYIPSRPRKIWQRLLMEASFCVSASLALLRHPLKYDYIVYVGAQPSLAMWCRGLAALTGRPYAVMINDMATDAAVDVGIIQNRLVRRALATFESAAYCGADRALVLCSSFTRSLREMGYRRPIEMVRSPVDLALIRPQATHLAFRQEIGLKATDFVILFAGSMGLKQGLMNVVAAAERLRYDEPRIRWVLVGDGEMREEIEERVRQSQLGAIVTFLQFQPESRLSDLFSIADVLLLNQLKAVKDSVIPSKLLSYMAAGRPVLAAVNRTSQGAEIINEAGGGVLVEPENPPALADAAKLLLCDRRQLARMGELNRRYAESHFDQGVILRDQLRFISRLEPRDRTIV